MKGTETIYGVHAVRIMLERHPERVHGVRIAQQRDDPRVRAIDELARRHQRPVQRVDARALKHLLGDVAHQGCGRRYHAPAALDRRMSCSWLCRR